MTPDSKDEIQDFDITGLTPQEKIFFASIVGSFIGTCLAAFVFYIFFG